MLNRYPYFYPEDWLVLTEQNQQKMDGYHKRLLKEQFDLNIWIMLNVL